MAQYPPFEQTGINSPIMEATFYHRKHAKYRLNEGKSSRHASSLSPEEHKLYSTSQDTAE